MGSRCDDEAKNSANTSSLCNNRASKIANARNLLINLFEDCHGSGGLHSWLLSSTIAATGSCWRPCLALLWRLLQWIIIILAANIIKILSNTTVINTWNWVWNCLWGRDLTREPQNRTWNNCNVRLLISSPLSLSCYQLDLASNEWHASYYYPLLIKYPQYQ